ncbi:MAG: hypothetical protein HPM95_06815 [Alphaproteobacteria bacterium]|nr:hypothetical protein [Alphaproteobacteria bacterium]
MRWAYIYNRLPALLPHSSITISCDPRLLALMERSFPDLEFAPVRRIRNTDHCDRSEYDHVPSSRLIGALDNLAIEKIEQHDDFILLSDLLSDTLKGYEDFDGLPFFSADPEIRKKYRRVLPSGKLLVGLSWRSSVISHSRNEHYMTIEELAPILEIDQVQFVNLQYDDCQRELAWANAKYPGKILDFEDLDQFNDFDGVAALMSELDLVISPLTTPIELAGAWGAQLGFCRTHPSCTGGKGLARRLTSGITRCAISREHSWGQEFVASDVEART